MFDVAISEISKELTDTVVGQVKEIAARLDLPVNSVVGITDYEKLSLENQIYFVGVSAERTAGVNFVKRLRKAGGDCCVIFIVGGPEDVNLCVRPGTKPDGIIFRPAEIKHLSQTIIEICRQFGEENVADEGTFVIKAGTQYYKLPHRDIFFFEARNKKIAAKTSTQEISFYSNFETVLEKLPNYFIKCHKGFIVNTRQIEKVSISEMSIYLKDNCVIPFSRTYRNQIKDLLSEELV